jgi:F-type H+-transporting ATPase subunit alpha
VVQALEENGAMDYTVVINAPASEPAPFKYIAPYAGSAMGQHWMYKGEHALIIFDDLSKQAEAYREISLLLRRPAGREAYPGDVFYLHSRLLERCAKLSDDLGGGSLTGLPIIETKGNDVSAYIPTNVISITDGQIYLEPDLFNSGVRPAINVGISVSRVGSSAQVPAMKKVTGTLRIDLAQFRALEAFALFSSDLDKASRAQLDRGERMVELLKQDQYQPMPVERQVVSIWTGSNGFLDNVPVPDVRRFERELLEFMESSHPEIFGHIRDKGTLPDDVENQLRDAVSEFARRFRTGEGKSLTPPQDRAEPMDPDEEGQESVRTYRRDTPEEVARKSGPAGREASGTP